MFKTELKTFFYLIGIATITVVLLAILFKVDFLLGIICVPFFLMFADPFAKWIERPALLYKPRATMELAED